MLALAAAGRSADACLINAGPRSRIGEAFLAAHARTCATRSVERVAEARFAQPAQVLSTSSTARPETRLGEPLSASSKRRSSRSRSRALRLQATDACSAERTVMTRHRLMAAGGT